MRRWVPLLLVVVTTLAMSMAISDGRAALAALTAFIVGMNFWDAIDSLPRRHRD